MFRRTPQGTRRLGAISLAASTLLLLTTVAGAPASAAAVEEAADPGYVIPGVDEISMSSNFRTIANLPKSGAFGAESAYNTDIAFQGNYAFVGNYDGFTTYDISKPRNPKVVSQVVCPGAQNDITIYGNLLFLSVDSSRNDDSCNSVAQSASIKSSWEGIRIFDVSNKVSPTYVKAIETDCGSHTHTLVPAKTKDKVYVYVQSYSPNANFPDCQPPHDKLSIIEVPLNDPTNASVVATPNLFPDTLGATSTSGCHDVTVYAELDLAAGACMGDGVLMDISDRTNPVVLSRVRDTNFAFWHSATFNNNGKKVIFTDELGGGGAATCNPTIGPKRGANALFDIEGAGADRKLVFKSYFKIPRENKSTENCVAHNGSLIPAMGRDIMVQAWYQGGISVFDFTDSSNPKEIGFWERGPLSDARLVLGGSWSAYYHNGFIYSSDIQKGFDVLKIADGRTNNAEAVVVANESNVQSQVSFPDCTQVLTTRVNSGLNIKSGTTCLDRATVNGTIKVHPGASLIVYKGEINGEVNANGAELVSLFESTVNGGVKAVGAKTTIKNTTVTGKIKLS
ncbi:hypothetical protein GCM10012279_06680 [Micromonospora yangpuensis]|uniref:LVIVD repeat-containing protein n=1 Tax=Micromonospora yangpuensis TaxID=683228 RepID=A0A1C6U5M1_9ACTN|nr:hypothetical protein GCM10012279_06680 [Micromonospora yangpuensis]SCL49332.1 LVIVD repeat-containing protein [Micromonospora yangpuensis]